MLARWCAALAARNDTSPLVIPELRQKCSDSRVALQSVEKDAGALAADVEAFRAVREAAREALITARAKADDAPAQAHAVTSLDQARHKAQQVIELSPPRYGRGAADVAHESPGALAPGVPQYLTRFSRGGIAALRIDSTPVDLLPMAEESDQKPHANEASTLTFRFPVVSLHFLDIEAVSRQLGLRPYQNRDELFSLNLRRVPDCDRRPRRLSNG